MIRAWLIGIVREAIRAEAHPPLEQPVYAEVIYRNAADEEVPAPTTQPFAVAGSPRPAPWHIRRKELEAQHRTRRARLESFREEA